MDLQAEIERLRLEADTIMTRYEQVEQRLQQAHEESGDHWETGELPVTLETPQGEEITVTLDFEADPSRNAQSRYDRASELEAELDRKNRIVEQLDPLPTDPVAYLVCYHLDHVEGNYPKSMAGYLDAERDHVEDCCEQMVETGLLERVESGTVKQRRVKAKKTEEVRQHHTYYRLSREGDHLLRFLSEQEGQLNVLRHLPDGHRIVTRVVREGADSPRATAADWDERFEYVRHLYRALRQVSLLTECEAGRTETDQSTVGASDRQTFYAATDRAREVSRLLE